MKKSLRFALPSMVLVLTFIFTLAPSKMEAKGFGLAASYGPCLKRLLVTMKDLFMKMFTYFGLEYSMNQLENGFLAKKTKNSLN